MFIIYIVNFLKLRATIKYKNRYYLQENIYIYRNYKLKLGIRYYITELLIAYPSTDLMKVLINLDGTGFLIEAGSGLRVQHDPLAQKRSA